MLRVRGCPRVTCDVTMLRVENDVRTRMPGTLVAKSVKSVGHYMYRENVMVKVLNDKCMGWSWG